MEYDISLSKINIILSIIYSYLKGEDDDIKSILKKKYNKYLFLLLLNKYDCLDKVIIREILELITDKSINNIIAKANEKLLVNKDFREKYLEIENRINKMI